MPQLDTYERESQINIPPTRNGALWKVIVSGIKCPECGSGETKAITGKRNNADGFSEHYRLCKECDLRFRVIFE